MSIKKCVVVVKHERQYLLLRLFQMGDKGNNMRVIIFGLCSEIKINQVAPHRILKMLLLLLVSVNFHPEIVSRCLISFVTQKLTFLPMD